MDLRWYCWKCVRHGWLVYSSCSCRVSAAYENVLFCPRASLCHLIASALSIVHPSETKMLEVCHLHIFVRHWVETCLKFCKKQSIFSSLYSQGNAGLLISPDLASLAMDWWNTIFMIQKCQSLASKMSLTYVNPRWWNSTWKNTAFNWIFKTLFNKRFKDTEEHSKVNKLHRYITITSARFSLVY